MQEEDYREEVKKDKQEFVRKVFDEADRKYQIPIDVASLFANRADMIQMYENKLLEIYGIKGE